jgi:transposase
MEERRKKKGKELPLALKRKIIEQIDQGKITPEEAARDLGVHVRSIVRYRGQLEKYGDADTRRRKKIPTALKRSIVNQIEAGELTIKEATIKCGLDTTSIAKYWVKQFGCRNLVETSSSTMIVTPKAGNNQQTGQECSNLKEQLQNAHLKIALLETLIDIADHEFKTNIRKKAGAKQ